MAVAARRARRRCHARHRVALRASPAPTGQPQGRSRAALGPAGHAGLCLRAAGRHPAGAGSQYSLYEQITCSYRHPICQAHRHMQMHKGHIMDPICRLT